MRLTVLNVSYPLAPVSSATAGGAEQVLLTIDEGLVRAGYRSIVIAPSGSQCHGLLLPTPQLSKRLDEQVKQRVRREHAKAIQRALQTFPVDVIHLHGIDFLEYLPAAGIPVVVTLHLPPDWYPPETFWLNRPDVHLVCVSDSQRAACPRGSRVARVVTNGVAVHKPMSNKKGNYLLYLGRICQEKGLHLAFDAADKAGLALYVAGQVFDYPEHQDYFEHEIRPRLRTPHRFLGPVGGSRKRQLLAGARCVLVPTMAQETSSLVAMEAMYCGTPVIAFRKGALPEVIEQGRTGLLVDSVDEMAEAILQAGNLDSNFCTVAAATRFSAERMVSEYIGLYQSVVSQSASAYLEVAC